MGHKHFPGSSQFFDDEHDQGWNHIHPEHPYTNSARSRASESRSHVYPAEMPVSSHWNSSSGPNVYTASGHSVERPHYNPGAPGPSHDPFVSSTVATFSTPHESYVTFASSSNCNIQTWSNSSYIDPSKRIIMATEPYPSRHLRAPPHISWRNGDRTGSRRNSYERFQPPFDEAALHVRFSSEGFMVVDHQQHYGSRNMLDHHRDLRLDIDDMT